MRENFHTITIKEIIPEKISGRKKADCHPNHQWDLETCISSHGIDQLVNQCTISLL
jgi:hypothetical protein